MARFIYISGVDQAASVRFPNGYTTASAAEQGAVSLGTIEIDDPNGTFNIVNLNPAYIVETLATPQRLWTGFLYNLTIERGPYETGAGRVWKAECVDVNWMLTQRIVLSANGTRPAETDLVRLTWLLANPVLSGLVYSGAYTNLTTNARGLDEADYRYQNPMEVLSDVAPQSGKLAFAFFNPATSRVELFYDEVGTTTYDSSAKISNVLSDAGTGVFAPFKDASMERVGENMASKAVLRWVGGVTTAENVTTRTTYGEMTYTWDSSRVGKATTAASQVATILANKALPEDTVTCTVLLPPAYVNDILEGQRVQVKFSHLPGWGQDLAYHYARVIRRAVAVDDSDNYLVQLTLSNKTRVALGGGPSVDLFPTPPPSDPVHYAAGTFNYLTDGSGSSAGPLATVPGAPNSTTAVTGDASVTLLLGTTYTYHFLHTLDPADLLTGHEVGLADGGTWNLPRHVTSGGDGTVLYEGSFTANAGNAGTHSIVASAGAASHIPKAAAMEWWFDPDGWEPGGVPTPPRSGRWVYDETPTPTPGGGNRVFYTLWPYASGSLIVKVDDIVQIATESNPATGQFILAFDPRSWETIKCTYQGL